MEQCKYIMLEEYLPILFHCSMNHAVMANMFSSLRVTSAGVVQVLSDCNEITVFTGGESASLKLKPAENDAYWIKKMLTE